MQPGPGVHALRGCEGLTADRHADFSHCASSNLLALGRSSGSSFTIDCMKSRKEVFSAVKSCGFWLIRSSGDGGNVDGLRSLSER
jgi:hypothetical protein